MNVKNVLLIQVAITDVITVVEITLQVVPYV